MSKPAFPSDRNVPFFAADSSEYRAELLRFLRVPMTLLIASVLILLQLGTPALSWRYDSRNDHVIRSYAITWTGERFEYPGAVPFLFFVSSDGSILFPETRF